MPPDLEEKTRIELAMEIVRLRNQVSDLSRMLFGQSTERFVGKNKAVVDKAADKGTTTPDKDDAASNKPQDKTATDNKPKPSKPVTLKPARIHPGRAPLPAELERRDVIIEPSENVEGMKCIGEEVTEELVYEPGHFWVKRYIRRKYVDPKSETILIGALPSRPVDKSIVSAELAAQIVVNKYCDHLPLYRQGKIFERSGVKIADSTLGDWLHTSVELLKPLYEALTKLAILNGYLQADETTIKVMDKDKKGATHLGFYWVFHAPELGIVIFEYQRGRGREGPVAFLKDFKGHLQCDGYEAYTIFEKQDDINVHNCWGHSRRYFEKALPEEPIRAAYVMELIQELYAIERQAKTSEFTAEQRGALRQKAAIPVLDKIKAYLEEQKASVLPKSLLGTAINYALARWNKLMSYTTDGRLEIDNNLVENAIRPVALGRKNYLFAGSHEAAQRAAMIYSLISCCKVCGVEPLAYFTELFQKLPDYPVNQVQDLLPFNINKAKHSA